jgi:starch phosphorylase
MRGSGYRPPSDEGAATVDTSPLDAVLGGGGGATDLEERAESLAARLPEELHPLARVAYNYRWSWARDGAATFRDINPYRWALLGENPVRFLSDLWPATVERAASDPVLRERAQALEAEVNADLARPPRPRSGVDGPVAFLCAEFGVHVSLPVYSGGLGVLAGDILKEASDQALPLVAVGLFYRRGYFRQRLDLTGRQQEYWVVSDPRSLPMARVTGADGQPLKLSVHVFGAETWFQVWRVQVGRVPLYLIDSEIPENEVTRRWTTARLYEGNRAIRLAQYALLGLGGIRTLEALGIEPAVFHLNEGHPALAGLELAARAVADGSSLDDALDAVRERFVFTTHTPVPAGNETYGVDELLAAYDDLPGRLGISPEELVGLCRARPDDESESPGMTPLAIRLSRTRNGVSRLHGEVARRMWQPMFPVEAAEDVPITHVTNGAHMPTFVSPAFAELFDRHLGDGWWTRSADPATWEPVREIPNAELWAARNAARGALIDWTREKSQNDRLLRNEQIDYVNAAARALDPDVLTLGFARRLATYKRLDLLTYDEERALAILMGEQPVQLLLAGKAHPQDEGGKGVLQNLFNLRAQSLQVSERVVFLEDYDLSVAPHLVSGCDVWVNLPRRPLEASGTSGMKASFNGVLQLSVLDGWWAEAFDGENGWGIPGEEDPDPAVMDARDADDFYGLLEREVIPQFYERGDDGVPHRWCERVKASLLTNAPRFSAARMIDEYAERIYPARA